MEEEGTPRPHQNSYFLPIATKARPLSWLASKNISWNWGKEEQEAFELLKAKLVSAPILGYPEADGEYILDTDASAHGIGGVLSQTQKGQERVIAYYSKTLTTPERN